MKRLRVAHIIVISTSSWLKSLRTGVADTYRPLELTACSIRHVRIRPYKIPIASGCVIHFRANKKFDPFVQTGYWTPRTYRIAGNFRGVLILVIFVVDLAVMKFCHPRKLVPHAYSNSDMRVYDGGRGHKHRGSAANTSVACPRGAQGARAPPSALAQQPDQ